MCGRFTATFEFSDIRVGWNLDRYLPNDTPRFNIAPETLPNILVIVRQKGVNESCNRVDSALGRRPEYRQSDDQRES
jgi:hypothetical protein